MNSAIESGVSWFSYWDSHDVDRKFAFNSLEYSLGLLTNEGKVKEQGRAFRQLADTYRGKQVKFPTDGSATAACRAGLRSNLEMALGISELESAGSLNHFTIAGAVALNPVRIISTATATQVSPSVERLIRIGCFGSMVIA